MFDGKYLRVKELAVMYGLGLNKAYQLCRDPSLPIIKIGKTILVDREKFENVWLEDKQKTTVKGVKNK